MSQFRVIESDALDALAGLDADSVDAIVTDPPAGISFMGRTWDRDHGGRDGWVSHMTGIFKQCLRVLKPGAHAFVWALPRTSHWTASAVEGAGFQIRDVITHHFGSGFPKSRDVSKDLDSRKDWHALRELQGAVRTARAALEISQSEAARRMGLIAAGEILGGGGFMWFETGMRVPTREQWPKLKAALGLDDALDAAFEAAEREVIGTATGKDSRAPGGVFSSGVGGYAPKEYDLTAPETEVAKAWAGWGTGLKPASEHWILARKPLPGTVAANLVKHGTGALNVDGCRVGIRGGTKGVGVATHTNAVYGPGMGMSESEPLDAGRWPPNMLLTHSAGCYPPLTAEEEEHALGSYFRAGQNVRRCAEGCPVRDLDEQSGESVSPKTTGRGAGGQHGKLSPIGAQGTVPAPGDSGGASRFFPRFRYEAKASSSEKNAGLEGLPVLVGGGLQSTVAGDTRTGHITRQENNHPTVKSIALMRWLCRLITPPGGLVLDPFMGSGTTGVAALRESFRFVGIERESAYVEIARRRIEEDAPLFNRVIPDGP
jgi:hypothetical protein